MSSAREGTFTGMGKLGTKVPDTDCQGNALRNVICGYHRQQTPTWRSHVPGTPLSCVCGLTQLTFTGLPLDVVCHSHITGEETEAGSSCLRLWTFHSSFSRSPQRAVVKKNRRLGVWLSGSKACLSHFQPGGRKQVP